MPKRKSYLIRVNPELGEQLAEVAEKKNLSYQALCRMLLANDVKEATRSQPRQDKPRRYYPESRSA